MKRQRTIWAQKAEQSHFQMRSPVGLGLERGKGRRGKRQIGILAESQRLIDRP
jgi:hypothetical protein